MKATNEQEGDGPLVLQCYDVISTMQASIDTVRFPNLKVVAEKKGPSVCVQQYIHYRKLSVKPGLDYFTTKFGKYLSESVAAFKAAQLFLRNSTNWCLC